MQEATLLKCGSCGRDVSSVLLKCPHCNSVMPRSVTCPVCQQLLNSQEAVFEPTYGFFFHPQCFQAILREQVCPVCGYLFMAEEQKRWAALAEFLHCPKCGHPILTTNCAICRQPAIPQVAINLTCDEGSYSYHKICYEPLRRLAAQRQEEQRQAAFQALREQGCCIVCGYELGLWDRIVGRDQHTHH